MTSPDNDIRWLQRLNNFRKALARFNEGVEIAQSRELSELEKQGVIQAFEYTYELSWNLMRDYLKWQGFSHLTGSRGLYKETANAILANIQSHYHGLLNALENTMMSEAERHGLSG